VSLLSTITAHESLLYALRQSYPRLFAHDTPHAPVESAIMLPMRDKLLFAMSKLSEPERHIVLMRVVSDLSIDAIADRLSRQPADIQATLRAARGNMRRYLDLCG
jgi:DNA-directed RNA polymerase specialized sigma24 family protein